MRTTRLLAAGAATAAVMGLAACGSSSSGSSGSSSAPSASASSTAITTTEDAAAAALVPAAYKSAGLSVGSDASYAPVEYIDGGKIVGLDPDLGAALGQKLGIKLTFHNATFSTLITGVTSKRYDIILSAMSDNADRQKSLDFVDYFDAGTSILVRKGNPEGIHSVADLCGKTIALEKGTTQVDVANAQNAKCDKKIDILTFETDTDALLQVKSGRAVADMNDFPVATYNAKTADGGKTYEVVGEQIGAGPYGIGVAKNNTQLRDALQAGLKALIADGTYEKILAKWDVTKGSLTTAAINGGS